MEGLNNFSLNKLYDNHKNVLDAMYFLSHIIIATIFVYCLKKYKPFILTLLLFIILGNIAYYEQNTIPIYILPFAGFIYYFFDFTLDKKCNLDNNNYWKFPYFSILTYYIIALLFYSLNSNLHNK